MNNQTISRLWNFLKPAATGSRNNLSLVGNTSPISNATLAEQIYRAGFVQEFRAFSAGIDSLEYRQSMKAYWAARAGNDQVRHNADELKRELWGERHVRSLSRREWLELENTPEKQAARAEQAERWALEQGARLTSLWGRSSRKPTHHSEI